eukprot:Phypoly_transcript_09410.p1 GENE.Phypoly_transcript_09410~~Phypoly_transcript_09410.p1  ORF type:complete len:264 (+),score=37.23 Phypoly_transcript_09410:445-1236(+)
MRVIGGIKLRENVPYGIALGGPPMPYLEDSTIGFYMRAVKLCIGCRIGNYICITSLYSEHQISNAVFCPSDPQWMIGKFVAGETNNGKDKQIYYYEDGKVVAQHINNNMPTIESGTEIQFDGTEFIQKLDKKCDKLQIPNFSGKRGSRWDCELLVDMGGGTKKLNFNFEVYYCSFTSFGAISSGEAPRYAILGNLFCQNTIGISMRRYLSQEISTLAAVCQINKSHTEFRGKFSATWHENKETNYFGDYTGKIVSGTIHAKQK